MNITIRDAETNDILDHVWFDEDADLDYEINDRWCAVYGWDQDEIEWEVTA